MRMAIRITWITVPMLLILTKQTMTVMVKEMHVTTMMTMMEFQMIVTTAGLFLIQIRQMKMVSAG